MSFQIPKNEYAGEICNVTLGSDSSEVIVGGDKTLPFYTFEGEMPNRPIVAMEVYDSKPEGWTEDVAAYFSSVWEDPVKWAQKCVADYGADAICLQMTSMNPDSGNMSADDAAEMVKQVREAIEVPVIIYGDGPLERVAEVMKKVAEVNQNTDLLIGWVEEDNY
ncbi:MAG: hypothetical protein U5N58_06980 [Actinomycetota bacterium]|nr:hypothetical protein [Actinomycetota bacterium]